MPGQYRWDALGMVMSAKSFWTGLESDRRKSDNISITSRCSAIKMHDNQAVQTQQMMGRPGKKGGGS